MTVQDYHRVCAQPEVVSNFHRLHNGDEKAHVGKWAPVNFDDAPDLTKRRTVLYTSQLNIPTWLRKILGAQAMKLPWKAHIEGWCTVCGLVQCAYPPLPVQCIHLVAELSWERCSIAMYMRGLSISCAAFT